MALNEQSENELSLKIQALADNELPAEEIPTVLAAILLCQHSFLTCSGYFKYLFNISDSSDMVNGLEMLAVKPYSRGVFITEFSA